MKFDIRRDCVEGLSVDGYRTMLLFFVDDREVSFEEYERLAHLELALHGGVIQCIEGHD